MKRIANNTIILVRQGQRIKIKPNQSFDFTADEVKDITASSPDALRKMVNEEAEVVEVKAPAPAETGTNDNGPNPGTKFGKSKAKSGEASEDL